MKKEQLKRGDYIECDGIEAFVVDPDFKTDYIKVNLRAAKVLINKDWLSVWNFANPIKNNRIVSDKTFAIRLKNFIKDVKVCDPCSEDEQEYLLNVADRLIKYQIETVAEQSEIDYLKRINLL